MRLADGLRLVAVVSLLVLASCSSDSSPSTTPPNADAPGAASPAAPPPGGGASEHPTAGDAGADAGDDGGQPPPGATYRNSLHVCWLDTTCVRALAVGHGGDWSVSGNPYDSNAALAAAYAGGVDGVKIDVRVTSDGVPVIAHSSPIEAFESLDCYNKKIEEMTAAAVTSCHRFPSKTETFQRLDAVLAYLDGKLTAELTVKLAADYAAAIAAVLAAGAESFAYLEVGTSDLQTVLPPIPGADKVYYLVNIKALSEVDVLLDTIKNPRAFMYEFDPGAALTTAMTMRLRTAGIRTFTYTNSSSVTQADLKALYDAGFDVVSSNRVPQTVQARIQVNTARAVSPP
jgi:glycerophosphoryl diester phosphodiesterase